MLRLNVPVNNFSAMSGWSNCFLGGKCLAQGYNTVGIGFEPPTFRSGVRLSTTEPTRSPVSNEYSQHDYHKISKMCFELNTRAIGWSAEECASIALCVRGYTENRPAGCLQSVIQNTPIPIARDWLTVRPTD